MTAPAFRFAGSALVRFRWVMVAAATLIVASVAKPAASAETVDVYAAGSLREVVVALAAQAGDSAAVDIKPTSGGAGSLRERIEGGEKPDLFLSADMAAPRKLYESGRGIVPATAFAQNRMCLISRRSLGVTPKNLVDRLLDTKLRLKASTPIADPAGDYAAAIFDRIDATHGGAGQILREKTQRLAEATKSAQPVAGHSAGASLFLDHQIDMMISYCSGAPALEKEVPDLATLAFPAALEPQPVFGLTVLSNKPAAMRLALFLLSEKGQQIVKDAGLLPLIDATH